MHPEVDTQTTLKPVTTAIAEWKAAYGGDSSQEGTGSETGDENGGDIGSGGFETGN